MSTRAFVLVIGVLGGGLAGMTACEPRRSEDIKSVVRTYLDDLTAYSLVKLHADGRRPREARDVVPALIVQKLKLDLAEVDQLTAELSKAGSESEIARISRELGRRLRALSEEDFSWIAAWW